MISDYEDPLQAFQLAGDCYRKSWIVESTPKSVFYTQRHEDAKITHLINSTLRHCVLAYILTIRLIGEDS